MGIDPLYYLFTLPALVLSLIFSARVKSTFAKYAKVRASTGLTGAQAAATMLARSGVHDVEIRQVSGFLTDHYNPVDNTLNLSRDVYAGHDLAALGVACHEAGHAAQYANSYLPIKVRNAILPVTKIGSYAGIPLAMLGLLVGFEPLVTIGLMLYSFIMIFQLVTLPVELDASRRALQVIDRLGMLRAEEEYQGAKRVLSAAAMTYVAALAVSLANLLRLLVLFSGRRRD